MASDWLFLASSDDLQPTPTTSLSLAARRVRGSRPQLIALQQQPVLDGSTAPLQALVMSDLVPELVSAATATPITRFPLNGYVTTSNIGLVIATVRRAGFVTIISLEERQLLRQPWPVHINTLTNASLRSLAELHLSPNQAETEVQIETRLAQLSTDKLRTASDLAVETVGAEIAHSESELFDRRTSLTQLLEVRSNFTSLRAQSLYHGQSGTAVQAAVADLIAEVDTAGATLTAMSSIDLQLEIQELQRLERAEAASDNARDRRIAQFATTLLLPSLWVGLIGANTLPPTINGTQTNTVPFFGLTIAGTLLLGALGWTLATLLTRRGRG